MRTSKTLAYRKLAGIQKADLSETIASYLMLSPQIIGFFVFTIYPIIWVNLYAFYEYDGVTAVFNGLDNFVRLFTRDFQYWVTLLNTFIIAYGKLVVELPLAIVVAVLVNKEIFGKSIFRATFYMPNIISTAIIGVVFSAIFSSFNSIANNTLMTIGVLNEPLNWFGNKWTSMLVIMISSIWQGFGANMLFLLAGLQNIPDELYEAAKIDGASDSKQFFHITIPMLAPVLQIVLMLAMVNGLKIMDLVMVLTNGAPAGETDVVMLYIYRYYFESVGGTKQIGYASAMGAVTSVIICIATLIYLKMSKKASTIY